MQGLRDTSLTHALQQGGWEFYGWGQDRHLLADLFDGLAVNTEVSGRLKKALDRWPRPSKKKRAKTGKKVSVADLFSGLPTHAKQAGSQLQK